MHHHLKTYREWLAAHGVRYATAPDLEQEEDQEGALAIDGGPVRRIELPGVPAVLEHRNTGIGLAADHATDSVARALLRPSLVRRGERFWDVGCGTGVLGAVGALLTRRAVLGIDVDLAALDLARRTGEDSDVQLRLVRGSLLLPLSKEARADVVTANLPHKPAPSGAGLPLAQAGGEEGDAMHGAFAEQVIAHLPRGARVVFSLHSLPHPRVLLRYQEKFDLFLVSWKRRFLGVGEYGSLQEHFVNRSRAGTSLVLTEGAGRCFLSTVWVAVRR